MLETSDIRHFILHIEEGHQGRTLEHSQETNPKKREMSFQEEEEIEELNEGGVVIGEEYDEGQEEERKEHEKAEEAEEMPYVSKIDEVGEEKEKRTCAGVCVGAVKEYIGKFGGVRDAGPPKMYRPLHFVLAFIGSFCLIGLLLSSSSFLTLFHLFQNYDSIFSTSKIGFFHF